MTICAMNLRSSGAGRLFDQFEFDEAGLRLCCDVPWAAHVPMLFSALCGAISKRNPQPTKVDLFGQGNGRHANGAAFAPVKATQPCDAANELRRYRQRTAAALGAAGVGMWERAIDESADWWSEQMYRQRGLDPRDPRPVRELAALVTDPVDMEEALRLQRRHMELGEPYAHEFLVRWPDGTQRWLASRGELVRDDEGRAVALVGVDVDITERRRAEAALHSAARTERGNRARQETVTCLSHELRTPLNAVLGFGQLLLEDPSDPLTPHQRARLEHIRQAASHMLELVNHTLDRATTEAGRQSLAIEAVPLAGCAREAMSWMEPAARARGVTLREEGLDGSVLADDRRLRQVALNLLSNAVKYNRPGGWVAVQTRRCVRDGIEQCALVVRDSGRGLTREQIECMYEPFNRLGAEREQIEGTGMGLTITRQLVQRMGGEVEVESEVGAGTEFRVWLPAAPM